MNFQTRLTRVTGLSASRSNCCAGCAGLNRTFGMGGIVDDFTSGFMGENQSPGGETSTGTQLGGAARGLLDTAIQFGETWAVGQLGGQPNQSGAPANAPRTDTTTAPPTSGTSMTSAAVGIGGGAIALVAAIAAGVYFMMK